MLVDKAGHIWFDGGEKKSSIESNNGIWRYNGKIFENFNYLQGMGKNSAWSFLQDAAGNIWIGTRNCELFRYDGKTFTCFSK